MANPSADSNPIDRLSNLPDELLVTILSFLPTRIAARTSVFCRRFRHLWEASPSLDFDIRYISFPKTDNFCAMAKRVLLSRNPSHPLLSLRLEGNFDRSASLLPSLFAKARSLNLRQLTINCHFSKFSPFLPIIFTINSLRCLSLDCSLDPAISFPSGITLTCLRSLSLTLRGTGPTNLNGLLSELCSLEDLQLYINITHELSLSCQTIRKLKLIIAFSTQKLEILGSCFPSLESLHLEIQNGFGCLSQSHIHGEFSLLRKAVINLHRLHEGDVSAVARLLNCISHVEELSLHIKEWEFEKYPIPTLMEPGKDVPNFLKLQQLDVTLCFHEHNFEAVTRMLHNSPVLKSLKLVHEIPKFTGCARGRKRKDWGSRLPRNADRNCRYAYFKDLHLEKKRKEVIKLLSKKCSSKRQAHSKLGMNAV
ncbi:F-box/FBD/LRR-repeat protein [Carex littledalei]|uniref:F-box/FBD/LRR-repeat protein n=1 Tax=Carex littledalei TaxID=544730 RepID=A0A833V988_9POAL|nr:F-box/FBD/LRR-repeat protein [Carex littledalei]